MQRPVLVKHTLVFYMLSIHNLVASNIGFILSDFLICDHYKSEAFEIFPCDAFHICILCFLPFMAFTNSVHCVL